MNDHPGLRAVVGNLVRDIEDHGIPGQDHYPAWLDLWCDRLLKTTGYYRERQQEETNVILRRPTCPGCATPTLAGQDVTLPLGDTRIWHTTCLQERRFV